MINCNNVDHPICTAGFTACCAFLKKKLCLQNTPEACCNIKSQREQELLRTNAASICQRISSGEEGAVEDYLAFLKLGDSQSPDELLSVAKVDPLDSQTYQLTLDFFGNLVDEYEQICNR